MKKKVNSNYICSKIFVDQLVVEGLKYVCISPGSRSTPLTSAFAVNKKIKCFVNPDERSSGFFALGLAKSTKNPVAIVTTSGTAVAELYPAIIEAFKSRVPLIVCTADRPTYLRNSGANQTVNQKNIFQNHIRWFYEMDLPKVQKKCLLDFRSIAHKSFNISYSTNPGPVHINFLFQKPLEPDSHNSILDTKIFDSAWKAKLKFNSESFLDNLDVIKKIAQELIETKKCWIVVGPMDYNKSLVKSLNSISKQTGFPVIIDGASNLRLFHYKNFLFNYNLFLRSNSFLDNNKPEIILQFGKTPTSSILEKIFQDSNISIFTVNEFGDRFDSRKKPATIIKMKPGEFCDQLFLELKKTRKSKPDYCNRFNSIEKEADHIRIKYLSKKNIEIEPIVINEILNNLPAKTNMIIGNSLPIRDLDNFVVQKKDIRIFCNRGASGIDGVTSTALGIANKNKPTVLVTGDLSFLYDLNALLIVKKYRIPLTVFIINNNGGAIFNSLPISSNKKLLSEFYITPHNLNIRSIVSSLNLNFTDVKTVNQLRYISNNVLNKKGFNVFEIRTNPIKSQKFRESLYLEVEKTINKNLG